MKSSTPQRVEVCVADTTPVRYFTLIESLELLARAMGGRIRTPREVFDPGEDMNLPNDLLSEIGQTELYWARTRAPSAGSHWSRFRALRLRTDMEPIDLDPREALIVAEITTRRYLQRFGKAGRLGKGEAAVIALVESRGWTAIMDDAAGRQTLTMRAPNGACLTTADLLHRAAFQDHVSSARAEELYQAMRQLGYRGPEKLWQP